KMPDAQAAYESADSLHSTILGGANFVLHSAGWMESGLVSSYEKLLMDADRLGAYRVLLEGMNMSEDALAKDAYEEVEPAGHFLGSAHTMRNYETAYYDAKMSDSESYEQWLDNGSHDAMWRANARMKDMLANYEAPPIDQAVDDELKDFIARRKASMEDAWY
ncbi:MAG: trimethylamine methyltransferase family protein, partial [Alphaproteobacteria bacterium]